ncbi:discoidin domain-containing protein [uncultured Subdoligranulum sp.]|uniref:discoidin domain-containing protein n=1 Tax=uncultured Subdoligranulum sp. TaxID=512298 RepID=UPI0025EF00B8|nr:discoidin domain-containing protein [uncultured Subdoligranulum sp.]
MGLMSVGGTGGGQYKNLVPPLTSTSQNGYKVTASSYRYTENDVVKAFDGETDNAAWGIGSDYTDRIFVNSSNTNQSITVELPQAKEVRMVVILYTSPARQGVGRAASISVSGSNDGSRYTPLDGAAATTGVFMRSKGDTTKYKYYKIDMTRESEFIGIIELMLLGK